MTLTRSIKFVKHANQFHNLTHFICIPLTTSSSRPLLQRSLGVLRESPASASVPSEAFLPLGMLQLSLKIPMSLSTPSRFADAKKLLESLDLNSLTRELLKPSHRERSISEQHLELEKSLSLPPEVDSTQSLPLHVTLSSLVASPSITADNRVFSLVAQCHDPTYGFRHLCNNLAIIFAAAGLFKQSTLSSSIRTDLKENKVRPPAVTLIKARTRGIVPSRTHPGYFKTYKLGIDPRDLTRTFKDFVWAENIRLERLSICPLGLHKQLQRGLDELPEACSVPL